MPTDVTIGAGYCGEELLQQRFPGQYRDPQYVQTFDTSGYMAQFPGVATGRPSAVTVASDPDRGHPFMVENIPGVGQVVVPVSHEMVGISQGTVVPVTHDVAAISPVEHTMVGDDETEFDGLGDVSTREKLAQALACKAAKAVHIALKRIHAGHIRTLADAEKFVVERMQKVCRRYVGFIKKLAESATQKALENARPKFEEALTKKTGTSELGAIVIKGGIPRELRSEAERFVKVISDIAGKTAAKAVEMTKRRVLKSLGEAHEFIRSNIVNITQKYAVHLKFLAERAAELAFERIKEDLEAALKASPRPFEFAAPVVVPPASGAAFDLTMADIAPDTEPIYNLGNWRGAMYGGMGDWKSDIAAAIASNELEKLTKSIFKVQDYLSEVIAQRNDVIKGYLEAKRILDESSKFALPYITVGLTSIPNPLLLPQITALASARQGVAYFARHIQTLNEMDVVFLHIADILSSRGLTTDADSVNMTHRQILKFSAESDKAFADIPYYNEVKMKIISAFNAELAAAGIHKTDFGNPGWFQAYLRAAEKVVPIPESAKREVGIAGLSDMGSPIPVLVASLIGVILSIGAVVVALKAVSRLIPDQNSKAETARQILLKAQERKRAIEAQMRAQGASEEEIKARLEAIDKETEKDIKNIPEPRSPLEVLALPAGIVAGGAILLKIAGVL